VGLRLAEQLSFRRGSLLHRNWLFSWNYSNLAAHCVPNLQDATERFKIRHVTLRIREERKKNGNNVAFRCALWNYTHTHFLSKYGTITTPSFRQTTQN